MKNTITSCVFAIVFAGCTQQNNNSNTEVFNTVKPIVKDTFTFNDYAAELQAVQIIDLRSQAKGIIESILVDEGQSVKKGQILFTLNNQQSFQELQKAKASFKTLLSELKAAEIEFESSQKLYHKNIIGKPELDIIAAKVETYKSRLKEIEAEIAQANLNVSYTRITAPFAGTINRIPNKIGSLIEEGSLLTTLSDNHEVYAYFNVSELEYLEYATNNENKREKEVSLILANGSSYNQTGKIEITESIADKGTGNIAFRAKFPNPDGILKHGLSGKIRVRSQFKNAMLIPQRATFEIQGNTYLFIADAKNKIQQRQIRILARIPDFFIVEPSLSKEENIILEGHQRLKVDDSVKIKSILLPIH